jgi:hypothetical protein
MMKKSLALVVLLTAVLSQSLWALPYIPGCPLHESCVRALRAEQRARRRGMKNNEQLGEATATHNLNLGFMLGLDDVANRSRTPVPTLKPTIAYFGNFGDFDLYLGGFYTLFLDDPLGHNVGLQETFSYNFFPGDNTTLSVSLDNDDQLHLAGPVGSIDTGLAFMSAVGEPSVTLTQDLTRGDITFTLGVPMDYSEFLNAGISDDELGKEAELYLETYLTLGYNSPFGLAIQLTPRVGILSDFEYTETELSLVYTLNSLYGSLTVSADRSFKKWSLEPYLAYTIGNFTFAATVVFNNIGGGGTGSAVVDAETGADRITITPSIGVKYRFGGKK